MMKPVLYLPEEHEAVRQDKKLLRGLCRCFDVAESVEHGRVVHATNRVVDNDDAGSDPISYPPAISENATVQ